MKVKNSKLEIATANAVKRAIKNSVQKLGQLCQATKNEPSVQIDLFRKTSQGPILDKIRLAFTSLRKGGTELVGTALVVGDPVERRGLAVIVRVDVAAIHAVVSIACGCSGGGD